MSAAQQFIGASIEWAGVVLILGGILFVFVRVFCAPRRNEKRRISRLREPAPWQVHIERDEVERLRDYGKEDA